MIASRAMQVVARFDLVRVAVWGVVLAALLAVAGWVLAGYLAVGEVRVPDVEGLAYEDAAARLREAGLEPEAFVELDRLAPPDAVVSQAPAPGARVRPGRAVALGVNGREAAATAPTLVGLREDDAAARLEAVGTALAWVTYVGSDRPAGTVVAQTPPAGAALDPREGVRVTVSRGPQESPVVVPDLVGSDVEAAVAALEALGIRQVERVAAALSFDRPGAVTEQRPEAGASVLPSTPVTLVYALEGTRVVRVPDVAGLPLWRAQLELRAARLDLGPVQRVEDATLPEGVVEARPAGYTVVGAPVALVVNGAAPVAPDPGGFLDGAFDGAFAGPDGGPPFATDGEGGVDAEDAAPADDVPAPGTQVAQADGSRLIPFRFDPASVGVASLTRERFRLTLVVVDDEGERTVLDEELAPGETVELSLRVVGDAPLVQTFLNGAFFQAWRP